MGYRERSVLVWCGFFGLAMINGILREVGIKQFIDEPWAHHISAFTAILIFSIYGWLMRRKLNIASVHDAVQIGILWFVMTLIAETFIVGRLLGQHSWDAILQNYNILDGNLWPLVVLWLAFLPVLIFHFQHKAAHESYRGPR